MSCHVARATAHVGDRPDIGGEHQLSERAEQRTVQRLGSQLGAEALGVVDSDRVVGRPRSVLVKRLDHARKGNPPAGHALGSEPPTATGDLRRPTCSPSKDLRIRRPLCSRPDPWVRVAGTPGRLSVPIKYGSPAAALTVLVTDTRGRE
jgi:hypothetical protein